MKKIKKTLTILLINATLGLFTIGLFTLSAQDLTTQNQSAEIQDVEGLRAQFVEYTQDPATKVIKFEMILVSNIDSDRVRITWNTNGANVFKPQAGYEITGNTARGNISIKKGETYRIPISLEITGSGINELTGKAEAFLADSTFIATVRKNFATNEDAEVLPLTDSFTQARTRNLIFNAVIIILIVVAISLAIYFALKTFIRWLDKDERNL